MPQSLSTCSQTMGLQAPQLFCQLLALQVDVFGSRELKEISRIIGPDAGTAPIKIADLGCGPGGFTARIARQYRNARIVGIDSQAYPQDSRKPSHHGCIGHFNSNIEKDDLKPFIVDADVVIVRYVLQHLCNYKRFLEDAFRSMKIGARFFAVEPVDTESKDAQPSSPFNRLIEALLTLSGSMGVDYRMSDHLCGDMEKAGFLDVQQRKVEHRYSDSCQEDFLSLVISYAAFLHRTDPAIMSSESLYKLEQYMKTSPIKDMYFSTSITHGIKVP